MPPPVVTIELRLPAGAEYGPSVLLQATPPQVQVPQVDIAVEVVGNLPLQTKIEDLSRLLGRRQRSPQLNRSYPPTILELITLVTRNPAKPRDRAWNSVGALTIRYDEQKMHLTVEYCLDYCSHDRVTGAFDPKRKMVLYSAPEAAVVKRVNKKLDDLKKYADAPPNRGR